MTLPPCKTKDGVDCTKRYPGCQDKCKEFLEFKKKRKEEKEAIRKQQVEAYKNITAQVRRLNFK